MINIPMNSTGVFNRNSIKNINRPKSINQSEPVAREPVRPQTVNSTTRQSFTHTVPTLNKRMAKGEKCSLETSGNLTGIKACFGWNTKDTRCDVDVSAFLLDHTGKVLGDSWFVFYGQTESPDHSTKLTINGPGAADLEVIDVDLTKLNPQVRRIVFVLTINEAFDKGLNFGMMKDAYVRILDSSGNNELAGFMMTDYYTNVISMMIGEIYIHNGTWKFNAIGNGVAKDLAGLCEFYGVQVI